MNKNRGMTPVHAPDDKSTFPMESIYKTEPAGPPPETPERGWNFGMANVPGSFDRIAHHPTEVDLPLALDDTFNPLRENLDDMFTNWKGERYPAFRVGKHRRGCVPEGGLETLRYLETPFYIFDRRLILALGGTPQGYSPTIQRISIRFHGKASRSPL